MDLYNDKTKPELSQYYNRGYVYDIYLKKAVAKKK
jgi:hypothetical protein